ncbi:hypothetical protein OIO90_005289 [Microbotryomycetes sp. JL221]|nr:hypothetical protein OIO90_005289 [Microbotryomycetes sp. JL221]
MVGFKNANNDAEEATLTSPLKANGTAELKSVNGTTTKLQHQDLVTVVLSDEERRTGNLTAENMALAVLGFVRDGIAVLENAVDPEHCDKINEIMVNELPELIKSPNVHWNDDIRAPPEKRTGNLNQRPPMRPELLYEDIYANKCGAAVLENIIGPNAVCNFVDSNTALGMGFGGRQAVHGDLAYNFPQFPCGVCFNFYLEDASAANGSTEVWLGTAIESSFKDHKACRELREGDDPVKPLSVNLRDPEQRNVLEGFGVRDELIEQRRQYAPPIQPTIKKGSLMLRDLRTWHAGKANPSNRHRVMLAFIHTPWWYQAPTSVVLPEDCKSLIDEWRTRQQHPINYNVKYVKDEQTAKHVEFQTDFSSRNSNYWKTLPQGLLPGFVFTSFDS